MWNLWFVADCNVYNVCLATLLPFHCSHCNVCLATLSHQVEEEERGGPSWLTPIPSFYQTNSILPSLYQTNSVLHLKFKSRTELNVQFVMCYIWLRMKLTYSYSLFVPNQLCSTLKCAITFPLSTKPTLFCRHLNVQFTMCYIWAYMWFWATRTVK